MNMEIKIFLITVTVILFGSCIIADTDAIPERIKIEYRKLDTIEDEIHLMRELLEQCERKIGKKEKIQKLFERFEQFEQQMEIRNGVDTKDITIDEKNILKLAASLVMCTLIGTD